MTGLYRTFYISGHYLFEIINMLILIRVILSWIRPNPGNKIVMMIYNLTEPILEPFRELSYRFNIGGGMIDFSPIFAILAMQFIIQPLYFGIIKLILL